MSTQYRVPVLEQFEWQQKVLSTLNTPPVSPVKGDRYLVGVGTGAWATHDNSVAWYDGAVWKFDAPSAGWIVYRVSDLLYLSYNGSVWANVMTGDMLKSTYDIDNDGIVDKAESVDDGIGNASTAVQVKNAVTKAHTQGTDQYLDQGGANEITAAHAKEAYDKRGTYDSALKVILFNL